MPEPRRRLLTAEDLYALQIVEDPQISPDGRRIAFVRVTVDQVANRYRRHIWLATLRPGGPPLIRQFTYGPHADTSPRWNPDGQTLAFVSARGDKPQIYLISLAGGEARPLTARRAGANNPVWSPDGKRLAFLAPANADERQREDAGEEDPPPESGLEARQRKEREDEAEKLKSDPRVITRLPYRTGTEFLDDRRTHVYVVDLPDEAGEAVGKPGKAKPRRLTDGELDFGPVSWSADGRAVFATQARDPDYDPWFHHDVVRIPVVGRRSLRRLTRAGHTYASPVASPDGRWIAVLRRAEAGSLGHPMRLAVLPARGGPIRDLTTALDRGADAPRWSGDSRHILFQVEDQGRVGVYRVNVRGTPRAEPVAGGPRMVSGYSADRAGQVAFAAWTHDRPADLYLAGPGGQAEQRLTDFNRPLLSALRLAVPQAVRYAAPDGQAIQGWVLKPAGGRPRRGRAPLVVHMHGGPHVMWGPGHPGMWIEWQLHAARGYGVFFCNPRGSAGYGTAHATAIQNEWGDHVMGDILAGVDHVLAQGWVDPRRVALTGGSYAGYLTAWIVGHDQRFACAWAQRGLYSLLSFFGTSDIPQLIEREFESFPFDDVQKAWQQSPLAYVRNIRTPLVIEHQDNDYRVPVSEAEQLYAALKRLRREVALIRYPREGHEMSRSGEPRHRVDRLNRMVDFFDRYCRPAAAARRRKKARS